MTQKASQCTSCQNLEKRLKVLQADYDFQIKKLNEDRSAEKVLYELNTNKQIKKLQEKCQKEKQQRLKQNQNWMKKYDELVQRQKQELNQYKLTKDKEVEQFKKLKNIQIENFKTETVAKLETTIQKLTQQKQEVKTELTSRYQGKISQLRAAHDEKMNKLTQKYDDQLKKKSIQYEAIICGVQSQKTVQQNLHRKTKQESKETQARLMQQMYGLKRSIIDHEEKIIKLKSQITQKSEAIQNLNAQMLKNQQMSQKHYQELEQNYEEKYRTHKETMEKKLENLFKRQLENCSKYQKALEKIQEHREIQNQMYKANLNDIKSCVEDRPSRLEDVQQIIKLKQKLLKKQKQCENLSEELKWYRLELENKQETYNKIFGPDSKNTESIYIRRKDLKLKRGGKSVTTVRQVLGSVNTQNCLAPLVGNLEKKLLPPKQNKIL